MIAEHRAMLRGFVTQRVAGRDVVNFPDELTAARKRLAIIPDLEGMDLSKALRAAGFNRVYLVNGRKPKTIVYGRTAT